jgi:hypothetical protein
MQFLYSIPGMEDVEDVIVSSGPNTWPNWRNFPDRIISGRHRLHGPRGARGTATVVLLPHMLRRQRASQEQKDVRDGAQVALRLD